MIRRLQRLFTRRRPPRREVTLGYACGVHNPSLAIDVFGSPHEIRESVAKAGLTLREAVDHDQTSVQLMEVWQKQPVLRFHGGPHAEALTDFLEHLDSGDLEGLARTAGVLHGPSDGAYVPLLGAAAAGDLGRVELLLQVGAPVGLPGPLGMSPLHWAAARGHEGVVAALLKAGASLSAPNWFCLTPPELAALNGDRDLATQLGRADPPIGEAWRDLTFERMRVL